jgi:hypothetical protein
LERAGLGRDEPVPVFVTGQGESDAERPITAAYRRGGVGNMFSLFRVCLLRADAVTDWRPLLRLSEEVLAVPMRELAMAEENQLVQLQQDWLAARGVVLCRQGRYQEARNPGNNSVWVFLAFAHLRLGQIVDAGQCMEKVLAPKADANFSWEALEIELSRPNDVELQKELSALLR